MTAHVLGTPCVWCGFTLSAHNDGRCPDTYPAKARMFTPAGVELSFALLRTVNTRRCVEGFKHSLDSWSVAEWTNAAAGEMGEACNITKKMIRHRDGVAGNSGDAKDLVALRAKLGRELADVVIYCDLVAASQGMDLGAFVIETFNTKSAEIGAPHRLPEPGALIPCERIRKGEGCGTDHEYIGSIAYHRRSNQ